jgi:hypothetical protein
VIRAIALAAMLSACTRPLPVVLEPPTTAAWQKARDALARLRESYRRQSSYRMNMTVVLEQKAFEQHVRGRGALAVRPRQGDAPGALRMIVLGPAGTTAMDLWICGDAFRFAIPAVDLVRRGDATTPATELRGLPVRFLRWWFLDPLAGDLLSYDEPAGVPRWLLREGDSVIEVTRPTSASLRVRRRGAGEDETLATDGATLCNRVSYEQRTTGVALEVVCESTAASVPRKAFVDPDGDGPHCPAPPPEPGAPPEPGTDDDDLEEP